MMPINILLVEDNDGDILLTTEALHEGNLVDKLWVVKDGCEAIRFLNDIAENEHFIAPDLILLDINLPKLNGIEVLKKIRETYTKFQLPIIVLSTSSSEEDKKLSLQNQATSFLSKPVDQKGYVKLVQSIKEICRSLTSNTNNS
jgi:CheY-like chemotaxis protein